MAKNNAAGNPALNAGEDDPEFVVSPDQLQALLASGNPALIAAMQAGLQRMVGQSSGFIEALAPAIRGRIDHLETLQHEYDDLEEQFEEEMKALEAKYRQLYAPLLNKRRAIVSGEEEAPGNEEEAAKAAPGEDGEAPVPGVPEFWAIALRNHPELEERITEKDLEVLAFVTDVQAEDITDEDGDEIGFKITFFFKENPFLTNSELTVTYAVAEEGGYISVKDIEGCDINWRADKDVTVKKMKKKPKAGSKAKPQTKLEPVESFFRWFSDAPEVPEGLGEEEEEEDEELEAMRDNIEMHMHIGDVLREQIVPHAVKWFTGEALMEMEEGESEDEDEEGDSEGGEEGEDSEEDDDDEEGGEGKPRDIKEQPAECKQQ